MLDAEGQRCERAERMPDGSMSVRSGMPVQGYIDDAGACVPKSALFGLDDAMKERATSIAEATIDKNIKKGWALVEV